MAKGRVMPQGKKVVQTALDSAESAQNALESTLHAESTILQVENNNGLVTASDGKNDHSGQDIDWQQFHDHLNDALDTQGGPPMAQSELAQVLQATAELDYSELTEHMKTVHSDLSASISSQDATGQELSSESMIPAVENNNGSASQPDASNGHSCSTPGCIAHNTREIKVDDDSFSFRVHFTPVVKKRASLSGFENLLDYATESIGRKVQQMIRESRKKTAKDGFPRGRVVDIDTNLTFAKTAEDKLREIDALTPEQAKKELDALLAEIALRQSRLKN